MADEPSPDSAPVADATDGGWTSESASAPMDAAPVDTTLEPVVADHGDEPGDQTEDQPPAAKTSSAPAVVAPASPKKNKLSVQERIDQATRRQRDAERLATEHEQRAADLERRLKALEPSSTRPIGSPAAPRPAEPIVAASLEMPEPPQYVNFETDADYKAAVTKWRTEVDAVWKAREAVLKTEIGGSVEARFKALEQEAEYRGRRAEAEARFTVMRQTHPDFDEKLATHAADLEQIQLTSPFLCDIVINNPNGAEFLPALLEDLDSARALAELPIPSRPLADAVRVSPSAVALMQYFATEAGREDFMRLRTLPPIHVIREIGRLEARLETADRGPVRGVPHPITNAVPPARPPVGSPRARDVSPGAGHPVGNFDTWMADEDRKEQAARLRAAGIAQPA